MIAEQQAEPRCGNCKWFRKVNELEVNGNGFCHVGPPRPLSYPQASKLGEIQVVIKSCFPVVDPLEDWCSHHVAK